MRYKHLYNDCVNAHVNNGVNCSIAKHKTMHLLVYSTKKIYHIINVYERNIAKTFGTTPRSFVKPKLSCQESYMNKRSN